MSATISQIKDHLTGMGGGASIDDVVNLYALMVRVANTLLTRLDPIETEKEQQLSQAIHDDLQNYPLPSDYKKIIDLAPQDDRQSKDRVQRRYMEPFAAELNLRNKDIAIESKEGTKFIRVNWKSTSAKTLHSMNSLTDDGTIAVVGSVSAFTSATLIWGNDLTTKYWTPTAQTTQSDATAVKAGWNFFLFNWAGATETGTVDPATIDSFKFTIAATGAISNIRVDNILVSLGRFFDLKYYSQYVFKNSAGTWIARPTTDDDTIILSGTALQIFIIECRIAIIQQLIKDVGTSYSATRWERIQLNGDPESGDSAGKVGLYAKYRAEHPRESKKQIGNYWNLPRLKR